MTRQRLARIAPRKAHRSPVFRVRCPACGALTIPEELEASGEHYVYQTGRIAGYCALQLLNMTDEELGYSDDDLDTYDWSELDEVDFECFDYEEYDY